MTPYYEKDGIKILHGDATTILPTADKWNLILTDPPYAASFNSDGSRKRGITCKHKGYRSISEQWDQAVDPQFILSLETETLMFCSFHLLGRYLSNRQPHQILHWIKTNPFPALGDYYTFSVEYILWWRTNGTFHRGGATDTFHAPICGGQERESHPSQKPLELIKRLISKHSNVGDLILDPFMGSGTTLRAAKDLGRRAIGIEIEERYCEIAAKRLAQEVLPL